MTGAPAKSQAGAVTATRASGTDALIGGRQSLVAGHSADRIDSCRGWPVSPRSGVGRLLPPAEGSAETSKRQPPVPIPPRLLPHLRRWCDRGVIASDVVEWPAMPAKSVKFAWAKTVRETGLSGRVTPHTLRRAACAKLMHKSVPRSLAAAYADISERMFKPT